MFIVEIGVNVQNKKTKVNQTMETGSFIANKAKFTNCVTKLV